MKAMNDREPTDGSLRSLLLGFSLREILRWDLAVAVLAGIGAAWLAHEHREQLVAALPTAAALVGVVIGVVIATATIVAAFLNPDFIRKMHAIGEDPARYLAPYLLTGFVGTLGALASIFVAALPASTPVGLAVSAAAAAGFLVVYALASMIYNLSNLVGFIRLQADAAEVPDDLPILKRRVAGEDRASAS